MERMKKLRQQFSDLKHSMMMVVMVVMMMVMRRSLQNWSPLEPP